MRRILLYLFVMVFIETVVFYAVSFGWHLFVEGYSMDTALRLFGENSDSPAVVSLVVATIYTIILLYIFIARQWCPRPLFQWRHVKGVVYVAILALVVAFILPLMFVEEHTSFLPNLVEAEFDTLLNSPWGYIIICLLAPVLEEVVFRGAVLQVLSERLSSPILTIVLSALIFSVLHFNPAQMPSTFLIGLLLAWLFMRTNSIVPGILYHWVHNSVVFLISQQIPEEYMDKPLSHFFDNGTLTVLLLVSLACMGFLLKTINVHTQQNIENAALAEQSAGQKKDA